jgi:hypothetical protein
MDQVSIKYTILFHCNTHQNLPKFNIWFENKPSGNPDPNYEIVLVRVRKKERKKNALKDFSRHLDKSLSTS